MSYYIYYFAANSQPNSDEEEEEDIDYSPEEDEFKKVIHFKQFISKVKTTAFHKLNTLKSQLEMMKKKTRENKS